jgi:Dolichyl-phosphate-mannose-protein mannosyltransferase
MPSNRSNSVALRPYNVNLTQARSASLLRVAVWLLFAVTVAVVLLARIRLLGLPLERDEGEYAYTGQLLLHGIPPYKLAYSMKFPGTSVAYAVLMSIFGDSITGIHLALILVNLLTAGLILFLGRQLLGEPGGIAAAAAYCVLSLMPHVLGQAAHATHFVVLFSVAGAFLLLRALDRRPKMLIAASGCLFGFALLMKQPGLFFVLFGSVYLFSRDWHAQLSAREIISRNLTFIIGASAPFLITCLALWNAHVFEKFWFWTIKYAGQYGSQVSIGDGLRIFTEHFGARLGTAWPIWAVAALGLVGCVVNPTLRTRAGFVITFAFFSALAVCPGFYFRPHYFILLLPAVSLLAGAALVAGLNGLRISAHTVRLAIILLFALCLAWPLWSEADFFFGRPLAEANRMVNGTNPFPESVKIGEYIRTQSGLSDTIAVLGSEPQIYFYSKRYSATGYIYTYGLMEPQPYAHQMQQEMIREIETARPKFLVLVVVNKSWLAGRDSDQSIFRWVDTYCDANYDEVGLVNISDHGTDYYFSGRPANVTPTAEHISIYRRKG